MSTEKFPPMVAVLPTILVEPKSVPDKAPQDASSTIYADDGPSDDNSDNDKESEFENRLQRLLKEYGSTWASDDDPQDPYNWPTYRKIIMGTIFSFGQLIPIMSASMIAPSLPAISVDLAVNASTTQIILSVYFLGMAFAPFVIASTSEIWGRRRLWIICNAWYVLWNTLCPVGKNAGLMIVGRFMTGAGASVGVTLNGPVMADMYGDKERGKSLAMVTLLPFLGPALGPIIGGLITQLVNWPWIFWIMSIFNAAVLMLGVLCIRESYTPVLLRRKATVESRQGATRANEPVINAKSITSNLKRPFQILARRPIIWLNALTHTLGFSTYTLMLSTYATLYIEKYGQSELSSSLHYISIAVGSTLCGQGGGHIMDTLYKSLSKRTGGVGRPEYRIPYMVPGILLMSAGLVWYGWSADHELHWAMVDSGVVVFTLGSFVTGQATVAYQIEEFGEFAASAGAAARSVSYILAFIYPIFAPELYKNLGYGWGNSSLAFLTLGLGLPTCGVLWVWGAKIRALGRD